MASELYKMTNEQAIKIIKNEYRCVDCDCDIERSCGKCELHMPSKEPILKAYKMAIQALSQEPTFDDECQKDMDEAWEQIQKKRKRIPVTLNLIPCDDAISRADAIGAIYKANDDGLLFDRVLNKIKALPSVTQKSGKWIVGRIFPTKVGDENLIEYRCSECDRAIRCTESQLVNYPYCHCGAKMESEEV